MKNLKLKAARAGMDLSQDDLAKAAGVSRQTISAIEKGDYNPTLLIIGPSDKRLQPDYNIYIECENEIQQMFANVLVMQQLALEIAQKLKRNVDHPKGLQKVVKDKI